MNAVTLRLFAVALAGAAALPAGASSSREWHFEVFLDDQPIGFHRFELSDDGATRRLSSEARFSVKVLGFTVYDYAHRSDELWREDCLAQIDASTDDNGNGFFVRGAGDGDALRLEHIDGRDELSGCVMTFAYWNPAILEQRRLLNVQTGEYLDVEVKPLGETTLELDGRAVPALHYRLSTGERDIDLWYSAGREWLGLSSPARGGRLLLYRRVPADALAAERRP